MKTTLGRTKPIPALALWLAALCWLPQAFATIQITGGNQNVTTLYVTLNGTLTSPGTLGMWYDVFQGAPNGPLLDHGALSLPARRLKEHIVRALG